jgi:uncharacterized protein YbaR (Trm112 family)
MRMPLHDEQCLALYAQGAPRHAIDRALLLVSAAGRADGSAEGDADGDADDWADRPLGLRDARLLALRRAWFGSQFNAVLACPACKAMLSVALDLRSLDATAPQQGGAAEPAFVHAAGSRFRRPTSRDLAAIASVTDVEDACARLLCRLALDTPPEGGWTAHHIDAFDIAMDQADPLAHVTIALQCEDCGHDWQAPLDIAAVLWDELSAHAQAVVRDVHLLAGAYGWSEADILAMPASRRQLYLQQVLA